MPYVSHSLEVKERAIALWDDPQLCEHVIDVLGVSRASIYRWKKNFELYGSVLPPSSGLQGRPSIVTSDMLDDVRDLLHSRPNYYIDEIQQWFLIAHGIGISATTVHRSILDAGYTYKLLRLRARLRNTTQINLFKSLIRHTILSIHIMATDETSKDGRTFYRRRGYAQQGEAATMQHDIDRGERWSLLPVMSTRGYEAKRVIAGNVGTLEFNDFILEDVVCPSRSTYKGSEINVSAASSYEPLATASKCSLVRQLPHSQKPVN